MPGFFRVRCYRVLVKIVGKKEDATSEQKSRLQCLELLLVGGTDFELGSKDMQGDECSRIQTGY